MHQAILNIDASVCRDLGEIGHGEMVHISGRMEELFRDMKTSQNERARDREEILKIQNFQLISSLTIADGARFESPKNQESARCFKETQVEVLRQIRAWIVSPEPAHMFWLPGMAGIGKSTIARTVAAECRNSKSLTGNFSLGASFFFDEKENSQNNAARLFPTLCRSLAECLPQLKADIVESIGNDKDFANGSLSDQWEKLILNPISKLEEEYHPLPLTLVVVIDALDECKPRRDDMDDVHTIVNLIAKAHILKVIRLKFLFTSRPEAYINSTFESKPGALLRKYEVQKVQPNFGSGDSEDDITRWLRDRLCSIAQDHQLGPNWPDKERFRGLVEKTDGLWQYASTACKFIGDRRLNSPSVVVGRLDLLLKEGGDVQNRPPEHNLDEIYERILNNHVAFLVPVEKVNAIRLFQMAVGAIVVLCQQISTTALSDLLCADKDEVEQALMGLGSLIHLGHGEGSPIRLAHLSFSDYLLDKNRCLEDSFRISKEVKHGELLGHCLNTLSDNLRSDISQFGSFSMLRQDIDPQVLSECLPAHVQYACLYWVEHLLSSDSHPLDDGPVHCFLKEHLLSWMEALSLMDRVSNGMHAVVMLSGHLMDLPHDGRHELRAFVYDVKRFMLHCRSTIEVAPLQIYRSALIYCPYESMVRKQNGHLISGWSTLASMDTNWSPLLQTLQDNGSCERIDVALSSDGKLVASSKGSVWDTNTGTLLKTFDTNGKGHAVTFSHDGNHVMIFSFLGEVEVWDVPTGSLVQKIQKIQNRHSFDWRDVYCDQRSMTPDKSCAAYSLRNMIVVSDTREGRVTDFEVTSSPASSLALSPCGHYLAIIGHCKMLQVWNTNSGGLVHDFTEDLAGKSVFHVAFSHDGRFVTAAGSDIWIWSMENFEVFKIDNDPVVNHIAFSPVGSFLYASSESSRAFSWSDLASGTLVSSIKSDHGFSQLSQDGRLCALLPFDYSSCDRVPSNQIKVWNPGSGEGPRFLDGHSKPARSLSFSRDASLLASTSKDGTVRLWDLTGNAGSQRPVDLGLETITLLYIFSDYQHVVASDRQKQSLWNRGTDEFLEHVQTHDSMVIAYSPNGIIYAYIDIWEVVIWSIDEGKEIHRLSSRTDYFLDENSQLAFSADSELIAHGYLGYSGDDDDDDNGQGLVEIWEVRSGTSRALLHLEHYRLSALAFSMDANYMAVAIELYPRIASVTGDSNERDAKNDFSAVPFEPAILIWKISDGDGDTNSAMLSISVHGSRIYELAWSPDGKVLASINTSGDIILWEISTRSLKVKLADRYWSCFKTDRSWFEVIIFSPDGRYLAASCLEGPTALWDMSTNEFIGTRQMGAEKHSLHFSADGKTIETSMGRLDVESFYPEPRRASHLDFAVEDNWVLFGQEKAVLLHHDYKPTCVVTAGDVLVMGHESGRISYLRRN
ncbi:unnamed protein product [Penicillium salamii]|uniref:Nephrocystin 3-like N-terminal domain-containing protein n=1 Tax=Penicillium salamii TaxID=1612424 RepID=A0A9W4NX27_9EURO|nr:unnamed protein product [Penicillium salamii]CAG8065050.1 unnamed protein product [Penicillium salamii]CAG8311036.1 unnamed protein product [Penicillium salamii]CAG8333625.1 unnamed protein product [Penicillium salamii]CAG8345266.1 unnamed protein product [Penicillium salamii]